MKFCLLYGFIWLKSGNYFYDILTVVGWSMPTLGTSFLHHRSGLFNFPSIKSVPQLPGLQWEFDGLRHVSPGAQSLDISCPSFLFLSCVFSLPFLIFLVVYSSLSWTFLLNCNQVLALMQLRLPATFVLDQDVITLLLLSSLILITIFFGKLSRVLLFRSRS